MVGIYEWTAVLQTHFYSTEKVVRWLAVGFYQLNIHARNVIVDKVMFTEFSFA